MMRRGREEEENCCLLSLFLASSPLSRGRDWRGVPSGLCSSTHSYSVRSGLRSSWCGPVCAGLQTDRGRKEGMSQLAQVENAPTPEFRFTRARSHVVV